MLSELFERLPEVGDPDKPTLVFFFDEAHLLFTDAPPALVEKIEQVVRLIRSKGVGVYFVTQNPADIPDIGARAARQPRAARAARVHAARSEGGQDRGRYAAAESEARHRLGDHRAGRGRGAACRCSTRRAARRSPSARGSCRRRRRSVRSPTRSATPSGSRRPRSAAATTADRRSRVGARSSGESGAGTGAGQAGGAGAATAQAYSGSRRHHGAGGSTFTDALVVDSSGNHRTARRTSRWSASSRLPKSAAARSARTGRAILRGALGSILGGGPTSTIADCPSLSTRRSGSYAPEKSLLAPVSRQLDSSHQPRLLRRVGDRPPLELPLRGADAVGVALDQRNDIPAQ